MSGAGMLGWAAGNMIWASAAMLLVLAIRRPVAAMFGAGIAYALWAIPLLRLVAPPADWMAGWVTTPLPALPPLLVVYDPGVAAAQAAPVNDAVPWVTIVLTVWAAGAALFLIAQGYLYRRFVARIGRTGVVAGEHRGIAVSVSDGVDGPLALGLVKRRIVVPAAFFEHYSADERRLALDHERFHHRRGDILANHVALVVLAANWFNPVAWAAFRAFRADQELSCDAAITADATPAGRSDYARALVKSASAPGLVAICPLNGADQLKRRLRMIARHRRDPRRMVAGSGVVMLLGAASLASGAPAVAGAADLAPVAPAPAWTPAFDLAADAPPLVEISRVVLARAPAPTVSEAAEAATPAAPMPTTVVLEPRVAGGAVPVAFAENSIVLRRVPDGTFRAEGASPSLARRIGECRDVPASRDGENSGRTIVVCAPPGSDHRAIGAAIGTSHDRVVLNSEGLRRARDGIAADSRLAEGVRQRMIEQLDALIAKADNP